MHMIAEARWRVLAISLLLAAAAGLAADDSRESAPVVLEVANESGKTVKFTAADLARLPQKEVTARDHKGDEAKYSGVLISDVLKEAETPLGERLRGKLLTNYLLVEAADNYRVVFSIPEIDPDWTDHIVLLARSRNGEALDAAHGPLQLVLPHEKRHSRWVKQVARLSIHPGPK